MSTILPVNTYPTQVVLNNPIVVNETQRNYCHDRLVEIRDTANLALQSLGEVTYLEYEWGYPGANHQAEIALSHTIDVVDNLSYQVDHFNDYVGICSDTACQELTYLDNLKEGYDHHLGLNSYDLGTLRGRVTVMLGDTQGNIEHLESLQLNVYMT